MSGMDFSQIRLRGRNTSIAMGGLSGSLASAFTSIALGDDDSKVAKNIYIGNFVTNYKYDSTNIPLNFKGSK